MGTGGITGETKFGALNNVSEVHTLVPGVPPGPLAFQIPNLNFWLEPAKLTLI